jgi:hypothetical protein
MLKAILIDVGGTLSDQTITSLAELSQAVARMEGDRG